MTCLFLVLPVAAWPLVGQDPSLSLESFMSQILRPDKPFDKSPCPSPPDYRPSLGLAPEKRGLGFGPMKEILA